MRVTAPKTLLTPILALTLVVGAIMGRPAHADIAPSLEADVSASFDAVVLQQGGQNGKKKTEDDGGLMLPGNPFTSVSQSNGRSYATQTNQSWGRPSASPSVPGTTTSSSRPGGPRTTGPIKRPTRWKDRGFVGTRYIPPALSPVLP